MKKIFLLLLISLFFFNQEVLAKSSLECLSETIYHEGRNLSHSEKVKIASVVLNRKYDRKKRFRNTICDVVYQKDKIYGKNVYQFSWTKNKPKIKEVNIYNEIILLSKDILEEKIPRVKGIYFFSKSNNTKNCSYKFTCHIFR